MEKQAIKEYSCTIIVVYLLSMIFTLIPSLISFTTQENIFSKISYYSFVIMPTGYIVIGIITQYFTKKFKDFLKYIIVNIIFTATMIVPFLFTFTNEIWICLTLYGFVFIIGFFTTMIVRIASDFINNSKNQ